MELMIRPLTEGAKSRKLCELKRGRADTLGHKKTRKVVAAYWWRQKFAGFKPFDTRLT